MFKRVTRKTERRREEEEIGITQEMKDALGLGGIDTDSDESDSSTAGSDSESEGSLDLDSDEELELHEEESNSEPDGQLLLTENDSEPDEPPVSLGEVASNPIYKEADSQLCIICPGKRFKNSKMVDDHLASKPHKRRLNRYISFANDNAADLGTADPRVIVQNLDANVVKPEKPQPRSLRVTSVMDKPAPRSRTGGKKRKRASAPDEAVRDEHRKVKRAKDDQKDEGSKPQAEVLTVGVPTVRLAKLKKRPKLSQTKEGRS